MPRQLVSSTNSQTEQYLNSMGYTTRPVARAGGAGGSSANTADLLGEAGGETIGPGIQGDDAYSVQQLEAAAARRDALRGGRYGLDAQGNVIGGDTLLGTPGNSTATGWQVEAQQVGTGAAAREGVGQSLSAQIDPTTGRPYVGAPIIQQNSDGSRGVLDTVRDGEGRLIDSAVSAAPPVPGAITDPTVNMANVGPLGLNGLGGTFAPGARPAADAFGAVPEQAVLNDTGNPLAAAPIDRTAANAVLAATNQATSQILGQSQQGLNLSVAQAQLAQNAQNAQSAALGLARSGNRRDRAMLERQAIGEGAAIQSQAGQASAILRAQEEQANQEFRVNAAATAGKLGLDQAAAQINMEQLDLGAATDYVNQRFQAAGLNRQLNQQEAQRATNAIRDLKLIEKDYQAMDLAHQESIDRELTTRYGIDQQTYLALKGIAAEPGFWEKLALGAGQAATTVGVGALVSDERLKTNVRAVDSTDRDFEAFVASIQPREYEYRDSAHGAGPRLGLMAQDLERTRFGRSLVRESGGVKTIDVPALTGGVAAGLRLAFDRIAELESALKGDR